MSDFTSNLRRSKSLRYSIASGLGGSEGMGREGDDMFLLAGDITKPFYVDLFFYTHA